MTTILAHSTRSMGGDHGLWLHACPTHDHFWSHGTTFRHSPTFDAVYGYTEAWSVYRSGTKSTWVRLNQRRQRVYR